MKAIQFIFCVILAAFLSASAIAQKQSVQTTLDVTKFDDSPARWLLLFTDNDGVTFNVEREPRRFAGGMSSAWTKQTKPTGAMSARLVVFDCSKGILRGEKFVAYDASGKHLGSDVSGEAWLPPAANSVSEMQFNFVCRGVVPPAPSIREIIARTPPDRLQWQPGNDDDSAQFYVEGLKVLAIHRADDLSVAVSIGNRELDPDNHLTKTVLALTVINDSGRPLDVLPDLLSVRRLDNGEPLKRQSAKEVGSSLRKRVYLRSFALGAAAGMSQQTSVGTMKGTVYTSDGATSVTGTVVTTTPNYEAQRRANQQAAAWGANARAKTGTLAELEAKNETLMPGEGYTGHFYYDRVKSCERCEIRLKLAGTEFVFPVSW